MENFIYNNPLRHPHQHSAPKPKLPSAKILQKKGTVPTVESANLPMDPKNLESIWNTIDPIKQKHATPSQRKGSATSDKDATSSTTNTKQQPKANGNRSTQIIGRQ